MMETQEVGAGDSTDHRIYPSTTTLTVAVCAVVLALGACSDRPSFRLTDEELAAQEEEVIGRIADYTQAIRALDVDRMLTFYPPSNHWVYAGDGELVAGFEENAELLRQAISNASMMEEIELWNPHVLSLAPDAAAYTTEYKWTMITTAGDTVGMRGSWTYVMKRVGNDWMIFHSTGAHVPMER